MKDYEISYYLGDMYHCYTISATSEYNALFRAISAITETSRPLFHDINIKLKKEEW